MTFNLPHHLWLPERSLWQPRSTCDFIVPGGASAGLIGGRQSISLYDAIIAADLTTDLQVVLDAGDAQSYTLGQQWLDRSGHGHHFFLGTDGSATISDPTFNGSIGGLSLNEYWSFDSGDFFRYVGGATLEPWMQTIHKSGATFSWFIIFYPASPVGSAIWSFRRSIAPSYGALSQLIASTGVWTFTCLHGAGDAFRATSDAPLSFGQWNAIGGSIIENGGNVSFLWRNGAYDQVNSENTFSVSYTTPESGNTNRFDIGGGVPGDGPLPDGSRYACFAMWQGTAWDKSKFDLLFNLMRARFGL